MRSQRLLDAQREGVVALDIPALLQRFREPHGAVRVSLHVRSSDTMAAQVAAGELDVAVLGLREGVHPRGVEARELARERLIDVLPPPRPLAERGTVSLRDLADETFADFPRTSPGRAQSDHAFAAAGLEREVAYEVTSAELMLSLVAQGLAVTLLAEEIAVRHPGVRTVPVNDGPVRVEYLAWSALNPPPRRVPSWPCSSCRPGKTLERTPSLVVHRRHSVGPAGHRCLGAARHSSHSRGGG
ncbi:LysR substrate-binding domain-containing protein [Georgenia phoenicis]|uniref:LysR substrate-binding domain-containing protein n=1 Tax=unclassified Georgenia TaxID=2626815 RepID=UPI0039B05662